jgi:hypothetical protein
MSGPNGNAPSVASSSKSSLRSDEIIPKAQRAAFARSQVTLDWLWGRSCTESSASLRLTAAGLATR